MVRRSTWILLGLLAAAALAFVLWPSADPAGEEELVPETETIWDVASQDIASILVVDLVGGAVIAVQRDPEVGWRLQSPAGVPAESGQVEMAAASLASPGIVQRVTGPEGLEAFGLAPADYRLTLIMSDGTARAAEIGSIDPTGSAYYVRLPESEDVLLMSRYVLEGPLGWLKDGLAAEPTLAPTGTP